MPRERSTAANGANGLVNRGRHPHPHAGVGTFTASDLAIPHAIGHDSGAAQGNRGAESGCECIAISRSPPAVALQQQRGTPTTRSSVGSVTTLSNLLRMLCLRVFTREEDPLAPEWTVRVEADPDDARITFHLVNVPHGRGTLPPPRRRPALRRIP
jgi:hypothetical protein